MALAACYAAGRRRTHDTRTTMTSIIYPILGDSKFSGAAALDSRTFFLDVIDPW